MIREQLADRHIRGRGIEIGGRHCPLKVPRGALVTYVDRLSLDELRRDPDVKVVENETVVDDAECLAQFKNSTLDFIIANHVFEHTRNPLKTLQVWFLRLRKGGIVYAAIPEKTKTFDAPRPVTPFQHLLDDYACAETDDEAHYRDWLSTIDGLTGEALERQVAVCVAAKSNIHFHVWTRDSILEILHWAQHKAKLFETVELVTNGAEEICILKAL
jgi:SAM-dependent methyltransferase